MTDRRRNTLSSSSSPGWSRPRSPVIATKPTKPRPRPQGRRRARLPGQADGAVAGRRRIAEQRDRHHPQTRRPARRRPAGDPALGRRRNRRRAAERRATPRAPQNEVGKTAQLYFYDWEPNVIGAERQARADRRRRSRADATRRAAARTAGLTQYQAVLRAAKRPPIMRGNETTYTPGCTPEQTTAASTALVPDRHEARKDALQGRRRDLPARGNRTEPLRRRLQAAGRARCRRPCGSTRAPWSCRRARPKRPAGKVINHSAQQLVRPERQPGPDRQRHHQPAAGFDEGAGGNGQPNVNFGFNSHGKARLRTGHQGNRPSRPGSPAPGVGKEAALQHFAVVLDGQLITAPSIDFTQYPEGIDATNGSEITGGFTITSAQELAEELQSARCRSSSR